MTALVKILLVGVGGAAGAVSRYLVSLAAERGFGGKFAWGTLTVNLLGCFLVGVLFMVGERRAILADHPGRLAAVVGFLGAFTTFSTYMLESLHMFNTGRGTHAAAYMLGSTGAGLLLVAAGMGVGRLFG